MKSFSATAKQLIHILSDGQWHAGSTLGTRLAISRSAIWKLIAQIKDHDIDIDTLKGKGYRFKQPLVLLDKQRIETQLTTTSQPIDIVIADCLASTNDVLKKIQPSNPQTLTCCLAEQQTVGRGRMQRSWHSPFGANIYFSCLWQFNQDISKLAGLSLAISIALLRSLKSCGFKQAFNIKWPNDIIWQAKKLAGILIEIEAESHGVTKVIIGIGINVNMMASTGQIIDQPWTALTQITKQSHDRNLIISALMNHLTPALQTFSEFGLSAFTNEWQQYDYLYGKQIFLNHGKHRFSGQALGITDQGYLRVKDEHGKVAAYSSGDTSISKR